MSSFPFSVRPIAWVFKNNDMEFVSSRQKEDAIISSKTRPNLRGIRLQSSGRKIRECWGMDWGTL